MDPYSGMHRVFLIIFDINVMRLDAAENVPSLCWLMDGKVPIPEYIQLEDILLPASVGLSITAYIDTTVFDLKISFIAYVAITILG